MFEVGGKRKGQADYKQSVKRSKALKYTYITVVKRVVGISKKPEVRGEGRDAAGQLRRGVQPDGPPEVCHWQAAQSGAVGQVARRTEWCPTRR